MYSPSANLTYLFTPPQTEIDPPIENNNPELPIDKLSWEDFERLCLTLVETDYGIDNCELYGIPGQAQYGIDIFAKKANGKYSSYQCKRYDDFTEKDIKKAVNKFKEGKWASISDNFYLCTSSSLNRAEIQHTFETQKSELSKLNINLVKWDFEQLNRLLKDKPNIIYRFFGEQWVKKISGENILSSLKKIMKLDALTIIHFRKELYKFYSVVFNTYDPGIIELENNKSFLLQDRFIIPNVIIQQHNIGIIPEVENVEAIKNSHENNILYLNTLTYKESDISLNEINEEDIINTKYQDIAINIDDILTSNDRNLILGEAGSGKSTLLRYIILDLLNNNPILINSAKKWGNFLPVWIPFAFLTKNIAKDENVSIQDSLRLWFKSHDHEHLYIVVEQALNDSRLILFIDGLDEWYNISAAKQALTKIEIQNNLLDTKIIFSSRPYGFRFLQDSIINVEKLYLTPFSKEKQKDFIFKWFNQYHKVNKLTLGIQQIDYIEHLTISFQKEISNSNELSQLAEYPLLLGILINQKVRDTILPKDKINAQNEITSYLITKHPIKRKIQANIVDNNISEIDDFLEDIFCDLALQIQITNTDGVIFKSEARKVIEKVMIESLGIDTNKAKLNSKKLIEIGANNIGIIIERSPEEISFIHRQFLEFLAAKCLINSDTQIVEKIINTYCLNPTWHQTIFAFFNLVPNKKINEFIYYFGLIKNKNDNSNSNYKKFLIYEISLNLNNSPLQLVNEYFTLIIADFISETNFDIKKRLLEIITECTNNTKIYNRSIEFINLFYPNYYHYKDYRLISLRIIKPEEITPEIIQFLKHSFINGNQDQKLDASNTIQKFISNSELLNYIKNICQNEADLDIRSFALNSMLSNDIQRKEIEGVMNIFENSDHKQIKLFYIKGRVFLNTHTEKDFNSLISISNEFRYHLDNELVNIFINGWPQNMKLKELCLASVKHKHYSEHPIKQEFAWKILFSCFNNEPDVIARIIEELQTETYPFIQLHQYGGWDLILQYFKGNMDLIPSIDKWMLKNEYRHPEIAFACLVGCTPQNKELLKSRLNSSGFPHWEVMALLEGWRNDNDTIDYLKKYFNSDNKQKSLAADFISEVFLDDINTGTKILEDILFDRNYNFRERALNPFIKLNKEYFEDNILVKFISTELQTFQFKSDFNSYENVLHIIARNFYFLPEVQNLIFQNPQLRLSLFELIIINEPKNSTRLNSLIKISLPLKDELRYFLIDKISNKPNLSREILDLLYQFPQESDDLVKFKSAIRLFDFLKFYNIDQIETISFDLVFYRGSDYEIQRQIAFAGYLICKKLDYYFSLKDKQFGDFASPEISFDASYSKMPSDLIQILIYNFDYLYEALNGDFTKLSRNKVSDELSFWAFWAKYSNNSSPTTKYIIKYIESNPNNNFDVNYIDFLNRVLPKSNILKRIALDIVSSNIPLQFNYQISLQSYVGKILGTNFSNDIEVREILIDMIPPSNFYNVGKIVALCIGWPKEKILEETFKAICQNKTRVISVVGYYLKFLFRDTNEIISYFEYLINNINKVTSDYEHLYPPLIRRVQDDAALVEKMRDILLNSGEANLKIFFYSLLKKTGKINEQILKWRDEQMKVINNLEYGYDIVSNKYVSFAKILSQEIKY